ncbi:MmcQ/YjbR family DNA-binding protein [bacterium]|nr:MmcQ/YjbR family DNA-binding protein [bacterium]
MNNAFCAHVKISPEGKVSGKVFDLENNEEYLPIKIKYQEGSFVGGIRTEYEKILNDISQKCFTENHFIYQQTNRIAELIEEKYKDKPQFLWEKFPGCAVFKNPDNNKWYGAILNVDFSRLDTDKSGEIEVINIKLPEDKVLELHNIKGFYPAYHMNKKSWISIILNNTLSDKKIMSLIDESHNFTIKNKKK